MINVSIIIPAYNVGDTIGRALGCLEEWGGPDVEIIVVNDGSTDKTYEIVARAAQRDSRIRLFSQCNAGRSAARNRGILESKGKWIMFLDADDYLLPGWALSVGKALNESCDLIVFASRRSDGLGSLGLPIRRDNNLVSDLKNVRFAELTDAIVNGTEKSLVTEAGCFEWNACWSRLYRGCIVRAMAGKDGNGAFPLGVTFSEDRVFNLRYLTNYPDSLATFKYDYVYYWDLGESRTVSRLSPQDSSGLPSYAVAISALEDRGLSRDDTNRLIASECVTQFLRAARLPLRDWRSVESVWKSNLGSKRVVESLPFWSLAFNKTAIFVKIISILLKNGYIFPALAFQSAISHLTMQIKRLPHSPCSLKI